MLIYRGDCSASERLQVYTLDFMQSISDVGALQKSVYHSHSRCLTASRPALHADWLLENRALAARPGSRLRTLTLEFSGDNVRREPTGDSRTHLMLM